MDQSRLERLYREMERLQLDAALITLPRHVYYFTGFHSEPHERFLGLAAVRGAEPTLIVPALDREAAEAATGGAIRIVAHTDTQNPYEVLARTLPEGLSRVGIEKGVVTVQRFEALQAALGAAAYVDLDEPLRAMRLVKSPDEVMRMKRAVQVVEEVLTAGLERVRVGVTELDLVAELEYQMKKRGAEGPAFATMVLAGEKSALPHGKPGDRRVQPGEFLLFDLGVYVDGYASDITRTFAVGDATPQMREIYETVLAANLAAISAVKPGTPLADLDRAARSLIAEKGYGDYFIHRLGHGLGLDVHEYPSVHGENRDPLVPGMVFTVEPGVYLPGLGGVRIEDDVLVTSEGAEVLTRFPKELTVLGG